MAVIVAAFVLLLGCGSGEVSTGAETGSSVAAGLDGPVMVHLEASANQGEGAEVRGVVEIEGDCLYVALDEVGERYPVVWLAGTTWDPVAEEVLLESGESVGHGDSVYGGGGYKYLDDFAGVGGDDAVARAEQCVDNQYGEIAVVNNQPDGIRAGDRLVDDEPSDGDATSQTVEGSWVVDRLIVDGAAVDLDADWPVTVVIEGDEISGRTTCNEYTGVFDSSAEAGFGRFVVSELRWTEIGCEAEVMLIEEGFFAALQSVDSYEAADGLYVGAVGSGTSLRLVRPGADG